MFSPLISLTFQSYFHIMSFILCFSCYFEVLLLTLQRDCNQMVEKELQVADFHDVLKFEFEKNEVSSVFLTSKLSEYLAENKFSPYITLELENAKKFRADAVFLRYLDNGKSCIPQIYIYMIISQIHGVMRITLLSTEIFGVPLKFHCIS